MVAYIKRLTQHWLGGAGALRFNFQIDILLDAN